MDEEFQKELEKTYLMVKRTRFWAFLGGVIAFVFAAGFLSYQGALQAIRNTGAKEAVTQIEVFRTKAEQDSTQLTSLLQTAATQINTHLGSVSIVNAYTRLERGGHGTAFVQCAQGERVVGGGCNVDNWSVRLADSYPDDNGWRCKARDMADYNSSGPPGVHAFAICSDDTLSPNQ